MFRKLFFTTIILFSTYSFSQENKLLGRWILDKITYSNGNDLEINHPYYSVFYVQNIKKDMIVGDKIKIGFNSYNFSLEEDLLKLTSTQENLIYNYIKERKFLELYPEFYPEEIIYKEKKLYKSNEIIYPYFTNYEKFNSDLTMYLKNKNIGKKFYFDLYIIGDKNNNDAQYYIENSTMNNNQEQQVLKFLQKNKIFLFNSFGKDLLKILPYNFNFNELNKKNYQKFADEENHLRNLYLNNKFEELIQRITLLEKEEFFKNSGYGKLRNVMLGVSFLALNNKEEACKAFSKEGDIKTLLVRNYIKNFCQKK